MKKPTFGEVGFDFLYVTRFHLPSIPKDFSPPLAYLARMQVTKISLFFYNTRKKVGNIAPRFIQQRPL
jgi:hypothetical protein